MVYLLHKLYYTRPGRNDELASKLRTALGRLRKQGVRYRLEPFYADLYAAHQISQNMDGVAASVGLTPSGDDEALKEAEQILADACASPYVLEYE